VLWLVSDHAFPIQKHSNALFGFCLVFAIRLGGTRSAHGLKIVTLPLVPPKSHCHQCEFNNSSLSRGKGDPVGETRHAHACTYVRAYACTKEPRAMWLERRVRNCRDFVIPGVPHGFAVVLAITTGCEIGPFQSGGIEAHALPSVPSIQILVGYLFACSPGLSLLSRECSPTLLRG